MRKLRIAMVAACPFPANRGTPSRIHRMAEGVASLDHEVNVVTYHFGADTGSKSIEIHRIPKFPYRNFAPGPTFTKFLILDPFLFMKLLAVTKKKEFDLIHAHHFEGALVAYMVRRFTGLKVIYDAHTTLEEELPSYCLHNIRWLAKLLDTRVPLWSDHVIAVSDTLKEFLLDKGVRESKIDVIPTGVNSEHFDGIDTDMMKRKYELQDRLLVMYTGSLVGFQDVEYLIKAMREVLRSLKDVALVLVGNSEKKKWEKICMMNGISKNVIITGERPFREIPLFLAAADVVVSPRTRCPGTPQKLVNYMAAKKAIVSSEGSAKLLINEHNGIVVENGNTIAMANAIIRLLKDSGLREELGRNARAAVLEKYDWRVLCRRVEKIYYELMDS